MNCLKTQIPILNYEEHPAFKQLPGGQAGKFGTASAILEQLTRDREMLPTAPEPQPRSLKERVFGTPKVTKVFRDSESLETSKLPYRQFIWKSREQLDSVKTEIVSGRDDWSSYEVDAIGKIVDWIHAETYADTCLRWWQLRDPMDFQVENVKAFDRMAVDGCAVFKLERSVAQNLRKMVLDLEKEIREIDTTNPCHWPVKPISQEQYPDFYKYLVHCLTEIDVFAVANKYLKRETVLESANLAVNRPQDTHWKVRYDDLNLELPESASMHYDSSGGMLKIMLYLEDVPPRHGGFSFIPGSKRAYNAGNYVRIQAGKSMHYSGVALDTVESRKLMLRLPAILQNQNHFGDDILPGSALEQSYKDTITEFTGEAGTLILFDNYGLHKGGVAFDGERIALQLTLRPENTFSLL